MVDFSLQRASNVHQQAFVVDKTARGRQKGQQPCIIWFTGLPGAGKSTIMNLVEQQLVRRGVHTYALDGDNLRRGLNHDLGFTDADRVENIRRAGEVARLMVDAGLVVLCAFISPFRADRRTVRELVEANEFLEVFVDTPLSECMARDPKGLYAQGAGRPGASRHRARLALRAARGAGAAPRHHRGERRTARRRGDRRAGAARCHRSLVSRFRSSLSLSHVPERTSESGH